MSQTAVQIPLKGDLLPLSLFSSKSFSPEELVKIRHVLSHSEMMRYISEYENSVRSELVSLVNDNYEEFLDVSNKMKDLGSKATGLRDPLVLKFRTSAAYNQFTRILSGTILNSNKLKSELAELEQTYFDISELSSLVSTLCNIDNTLHDTTIDTDTTGILTDELIRCQIMIQSLDSITAETGISSIFLRETIIHLREEISKMRPRLLTKIEDALRAEIISNQTSEVPSLIAYLGRLDGGKLDRFYDILNSKIIGNIKYSSSSSQNSFVEYLDAIRSRWLTCPELLKFEKCDSGIFVNVLLKAIVDELTRNGGIDLFVPTVGNLDIFYHNYSSWKNFCQEEKFSSTPPWLEIFNGKWKIQIYVNMRVKAIVAAPDIVAQCTRFVPELISLPGGTYRIIEGIVEHFSGITNSETRDEFATVLNYVDIVNKVIPSLLELFENQPVAKKIILNEKKIFEKLIWKFLFKIISDLAKPMIQTAESVRQIPALYRVASRGMPTRHSVYVDLVMKPLVNWQSTHPSSAPQWIIETVQQRVVREVFDSYIRCIKEVVEKERSRTSSGEYEKIFSQIKIDVKRMIEVSVVVDQQFVEFVATL